MPILDPNDLELTVTGSLRKDALNQDFDDLLWATARLHARRRGSKCLDNTDFNAAYRQLLKPRERPLPLDILGEFGLFVAGSVVGYAITLVTQTPPISGPGYALLAVGLFTGGFCAIIKHLRIQS